MSKRPHTINVILRLRLCTKRTVENLRNFDRLTGLSRYLFSECKFRVYNFLQEFRLFLP